MHWRLGGGPPGGAIARLAVEGSNLILTASRAALYDRLLLRSFGGSVRMPLGAVAEASVVEQAWHVLTAVDMRVPNKDNAGTVIVTRVKGSPGDQEFVAVYGVTRHAVMVLLNVPSPFSSIVITIHDPKAVAASIQIALGASSGAANIKEGDRLADRGLFADAEASYRAAIVLNPTSFDAHYKLSRVLQHMKRSGWDVPYQQALLLKERRVRHARAKGADWPQIGELVGLQNPAWRVQPG